MIHVNIERVVFTVGVVWCLVLGGVVGATEGEGQDSPGLNPTFTKDVAPILFENCVRCHRPGQIAPMSLLSYQEVRPWSRAIKEKVASGYMPPWNADPKHGKFRNDRRLAQSQIDTIIAWSDAGAPKGNDADLPPVPQFEDTWVKGPPDAILEMPITFEIPAEGEGPIPRFFSKVPFEEDKYVIAIEMKPSNTKAVHHANVRLESLVIPEDARHVDGIFVNAAGEEIPLDQLRGGASVFDVNPGKLISYVPGRGFEAFWPGVAKRIPAGQWVIWSLHYQPSGRPETDRTDIGLYFAKEPVQHEVITSIIRGTFLVEREELHADQGGRARIPVIPPHADNWMITAVMPIRDDITVYALQPHAHVRSKDWKYVVTYPDGTEEVLLYVPNYDFEWQLHYELAEPKKIPAGSRLLALGTFDNSVKNRYNPAPHKEVYWAEQSWDEMFNGYFEYSIDKFDRNPSTTSDQ